MSAPILDTQHPVATLPSSFASLGLSPSVLASIQHAGFIHPTPIQSAVIPQALTGADLIGLAQTGSGKTAAFVIPLAENIHHGQGLQALILCPTREIALQTQAFLELFGESHKIRSACLIGGMAMGQQMRDLKADPDVVVATPGRMKDHLSRGTVNLDLIRFVVLDEADHMLDMGFLPQVEEILRNIRQKHQTLMFSATMPEPIERLTKRFLTNPERVDITPVGRAATGITHRLYLVKAEDKHGCLLALLGHELGRTLIFMGRRHEAEFMARILQQKNHSVDQIHSDRSQQQRIKALEDFREGRVRILIATDIAARGIDVTDIEHVINFDCPDNPEDYIHRAGRTARAGKEGIVSTIATFIDKNYVRLIEKQLGQEIPRCSIAGVAPYVEMALASPLGLNRRTGLRRKI